MKIQNVTLLNNNLNSSNNVSKEKYSGNSVANYRYHPLMTGKNPLNETNLIRLKKFFARLFRKPKEVEELPKQQVVYSLPKKTYKRKMLQEVTCENKLRIERVKDPYDIIVKNIFIDDVQIDKIYGKYLTDGYTKTRYEVLLPVEHKGNAALPIGHKMRFSSGYALNYRKTNNGSITIDFNKNSNPSGKLKSFVDKTSNSEIEVEIYNDINHGNYERRITKKVDNKLKSDVYCLRNIPELLVIYEKPGDFNGNRLMYKFNNNSQRIYRHEVVDGDLRRYNTVTYQDILENQQLYPQETVEIVKRNLNDTSNKNLLNNLFAE